MNVNSMMDVLKREFSINSLEEFDVVYQNSKGLDIGIFTMPIKEEMKHAGGSRKNYSQAAYG